MYFGRLGMTETKHIPRAEASARDGEGTDQIENAVEVTPKK